MRPWEKVRFQNRKIPKQLQFFSRKPYWSEPQLFWHSLNLLIKMFGAFSRKIFSGVDSIEVKANTYFLNNIKKLLRIFRDILRINAKKNPMTTASHLKIIICTPVKFDKFNTFHDGIIKWKHFPRYWPFVWGIHRSPVNSPYKASDTELGCFFHLRPNKRLNKQLRRRWFETLSHSFWRHRNVIGGNCELETG